MSLKAATGLQICRIQLYSVEEISGTLDIFVAVSWLGENWLSSQRKETPSRKAPYRLDLEDGVVVEVTHRKMKNLRLSIRAEDGVVRLSAPIRTSQKSVRAFALSNLPWIREKLSQLQVSGRARPLHFVSGEVLHLWGQPYKLHIIERSGRPRVNLSGQVIQLFIAPASNIRERERLLNNWYRKILKARIPSLLAKWEPVVGRSARGWGIRNMRSRWGTCNTTKSHIWLSLALVRKPVDFLEFIIVHELTHLHERNHNKRFYGLMDCFMPEWRTVAKLEAGC